MSTPVHGSGAARLLERDIPGDYLQEWTERIAARPVETVAGTLSVVIFRISAEWLALPTGVCQEVTENAAWHSLPHRPATPGAGLVNVRGELLLTLSLGAVLGIDSPPGPRGKRLLVVRHRRTHFVFGVDEVAAVMRYHSGELRPLPATFPEQRTPFSKGLLPWREHLVGCLDEEILFRALNKGLA